MYTRISQVQLHISTTKSDVINLVYFLEEFEKLNDYWPWIGYMFELTSIHKYITIVTFYLSYIDELDIVKCLSVVNVETIKDQ